MNLIEELRAYLDYTKISNVDEIVKDFQDLNVDAGT